MSKTYLVNLTKEELECLTRESLTRPGVSRATYEALLNAQSKMLKVFHKAEKEDKL